MKNKSQRKPALQLWLKTMILLPFLAMGLMMPSCQKQVEEEPPYEDDKVYILVDEGCVFPGGNEEITPFLMNNIRYPQAARDAGLQGNAFVTFVIDKEGRAKNARILRPFPLCPEIDEEALRLIEIMPRWTPGIIDGKAVNVQRSLAIRFNLGDHPVMD